METRYWKGGYTLNRAKPLDLRTEFFPIYVQIIANFALCRKRSKKRRWLHSFPWLHRSQTHLGLSAVAQPSWLPLPRRGEQARCSTRCECAGRDQFFRQTWAHCSALCFISHWFVWRRSQQTGAFRPLCFLIRTPCASSPCCSKMTYWSLLYETILGQSIRRHLLAIFSDFWVGVSLQSSFMFARISWLFLPHDPSMQLRINFQSSDLPSQ